MKKLVLGLLVAALMTLGLVGAPSAQADPYPGTVVTKTDAELLKVTKKRKAKFTVTVTAGTATPKGWLKVKCVKGNKIIKSGPKAYAGAGTKIKSGKLTPGKWNCKVKFVGDGPYMNSKDVAPVTVRG
ncbi:hypothetical protein FHP29_05420 [Nocardioides albidus]|uniref:Ig-like domain repeat protein n=1 Tax=Nocardioides albidus TaxID=1517589 RepID=A0A5C4W7G8_9ACTN|nr:hypothetical protein [Nocardioides albidus]TNM44151.1 hypothetical protein FHP29_05420 [Nocardioides albidus]